jgi:hypothetical protein
VSLTKKDTFCVSKQKHKKSNTDDSLDPSQAPPNVVVLGLLIDRRIQVSRSKD